MAGYVPTRSARGWPSAVVDRLGGSPILRAGPRPARPYAPNVLLQFANGQCLTASPCGQAEEAVADVTLSGRDTQGHKGCWALRVKARVSNYPSPVSHSGGRLQAPSNRRGTSMDEVGDRAASRDKFGIRL
jgi:hypothetical protein